jgi:branched-chain amino acid transport system ATP-binding protein
MNPALSTHSVSVRFGALLALDDVSINVGDRQIVSLIGPNGAGKTTLLNAISGLLTSEHGRITIGGLDVTREPPQRRASMGIRRTFQHARLSDDLTVLENVLVGGSLADYPASLFGEWFRLRSATTKLRERVEEAMALLESLQLADVADVEVAKLSFGRKKLVDLARALMTQPFVLLMDEPTAGLSEAEIETLVTVVKRIRQSSAIILVAHHMGFVAKVADSVICLVAGRVISQGTPREVQSDPKVLAAYMGTA